MLKKHVQLSPKIEKLMLLNNKSRLGALKFAEFLNDEETRVAKLNLRCLRTLVVTVVTVALVSVSEDFRCAYALQQLTMKNKQNTATPIIIIVVSSIFHKTNFETES
jgi:hypothetical protein